MSEVFDAVVLAGGEGTRLGGRDKALLTVGGETLLERVLAALANARTIVCVGPERTTSVPVTWTHERPPGGGPVAALAAGLDHIGAPTVVVVAVDSPFLNAGVVEGLVGACRDDAAMLVDAGGHRQPLLAAYRVGFLERRIEALGATEGAALRDLIAGARVTLLDDPAAARDIDTLADLEAAREASTE